MAFVEGTKIYTDKGWKKIEDISGYDKVFVRNFLGDAEFIQPFALKKKKYNGNIVKISSNNWLMQVTPDHILVYDNDESAKGKNFTHKKASEVTARKSNRIYRKFRYINNNDYEKERIYNSLTRKTKTIQNEDWFILFGYVLTRGFFRKFAHKKGLNIKIDLQKRKEEISIITGILDRLDIQYSLVRHNEKYSIVSVSHTNNLSSTLIKRLGSYKRSEMSIPDKMIYNSNKELVDTLINTIIKATIKKTTKLKNSYKLTSSNIKLIESLEKLGILWGYNVSRILLAESGEDLGYGSVKRNIYNVKITKPHSTYSPKKVEQTIYDGYVYEIDLFDGQVYVLGGSTPLWVNPK